MQYTTRNCMQLPLPFRNGVDISRVQDIRLLSIWIIVGWSSAPRINHLTGGRLGGLLSWTALIFTSLTGLEIRTPSQMHCVGVRSTALKRGGMTTNRLHTCTIQGSGYLETTGNCFTSVQFQGLRPVVKMSKWLKDEIVSKVKCNSTWQELYDKDAEDGALEGCITVLVTYKDGILFRKGKVWIPSDALLRKLIMESEHDSRVAGHIDIDKPMEVGDRNLYWPEMAKDFEDYVRSCEDCQKNNAS